MTYFVYAIICQRTVINRIINSFSRIVKLEIPILLALRDLRPGRTKWGLIKVCFIIRGTFLKYMAFYHILAAVPLGSRGSVVEAIWSGRKIA